MYATYIVSTHIHIIPYHDVQPQTCLYLVACMEIQFLYQSVEYRLFVCRFLKNCPVSVNPNGLFIDADYQVLGSLLCSAHFYNGSSVEGAAVYPSLPSSFLSYVCQILSASTLVQSAGWLWVICDLTSHSLSPVVRTTPFIPMFSAE